MGAESAWSGLAGARKVSVWPDAALQSANACSDMIAAIKGYKNLYDGQGLGKFTGAQFGGLDSGGRLATAFNDRAVDIYEQFDKHIETLTDLVELFKAAGAAYKGTDHQSGDTLRRLGEVVGDPAAKNIPWTKPDQNAQNGKFYFPKTMLNDSEPAVPKGLSQPPPAVQFAPVTVTVKPEEPESMSWSELYDLGQKIDVWPLMTVAPIWGEIADKSYDAAYDLYRKLQVITTDSWRSDGADQAVQAIGKYAESVVALSRGIQVMETNIEYTADWLHRTKTEMPSQPEKPCGGPSLGDYQAEFGKYYVTGALQSEKSFPMVSDPPGPGAPPPPPRTDDPGKGDPRGDGPRGDNPGNGNPGSGNPGSGNPGSGNPGSGNPGSAKPGSGNPAATPTPSPAPTAQTPQIPGAGDPNATQNPTGTPAPGSTGAGTGTGTGQSPTGQRDTGQGMPMLSALTSAMSSMLPALAQAVPALAQALPGLTQALQQLPQQQAAAAAGVDTGALAQLFDRFPELRTILADSPQLAELIAAHPELRPLGDLLGIPAEPQSIEPQAAEPQTTESQTTGQNTARPAETSGAPAPADSGGSRLFPRAALPDTSLAPFPTPGVPADPGVAVSAGPSRAAAYESGAGWTVPGVVAGSTPGEPLVRQSIDGVEQEAVDEDSLHYARPVVES
ncbi:hypothetical protein [Nocardia farcinica]|uniref:hypothetical protein n=1 Tax=Nocardia farcinica TaxID=37329 RepID=UPI001E5188AC|nr:hypothetical protein [Nocardia farcinica]MCZ9327814.1 hypothetical protein [Nocardia farcinica]